MNTTKNKRAINNYSILQIACQVKNIDLLTRFACWQSLIEKSIPYMGKATEGMGYSHSLVSAELKNI